MNDYFFQRQQSQECAPAVPRHIHPVVRVPRVGGVAALVLVQPHRSHEKVKKISDQRSIHCAESWK